MTRRTLPKADIVWKQIDFGKGLFFLTSDAARLKYSIWKKVSTGYELLGTGQYPDKLEMKFAKQIYG